jgi:hypothetical protein
MYPLIEAARSLVAEGTLAEAVRAALADEGSVP